MRKWMETMQRTFKFLIPRTNYLRRLIWFGCLTVSIPILIAGSAYYSVSVSKLTNQFKEDNKNALILVKDRMENIFGNIEQKSLEISISPLIKGNVGKKNFGSEWLQQMEILDMFQVNKNSYRLIDDIVFYEGLSDVVMTNNYGYVQMGNYKESQDIQLALNGKTQASWSYLPEARKSGYISYIRRITDIPADSSQSVLILQVKEEMLKNNMLTYSNYSKNQSLFILDSNNHTILQTTHNDTLNRMNLESIDLNPILNSDESSGQLVLKSENEHSHSYIAVYQKTLLGRTYISLNPEGDLLEQVGWIRWLTIILVIVLIILGMLLSYLTSKIAYNPIGKLIRYGENLQGKGSIKRRENEIEYIKSCFDYLNEQARVLDDYMHRTKPNLREHLLKKLLKGYAGRGNYLLKECEEYQIPIKGNYVVMITVVDNLLKEKRFMPSEGSIMVFAVINVIKELLSRSTMQGFVVENNERESITILHFAENMPREQMLEMTRVLAEEIKTAMNRYLSFSVASGIGGIYQEVNQISDSYREAQGALQYRFFNDSIAILFFDEIRRSQTNSLFFYPREHEKCVIEALLQDDLITAEKGLELFAKTVRISESYNTIYQCYHMLLSSIIQSLENEGPGVIDSLEDNWFDQLKACQTARENYEWIIETIFPLYQQITEDFRKKNVKTTIQKVCKLISENACSNYSLIDYALMVGMSPSYLSRMFKKERGVSFVEYLMEIKVERAKQSLQDTDLTVTEIAEIVGYSERNLTRTFQRFVGMSPKQYRMSRR